MVDRHEHDLNHLMWVKVRSSTFGMTHKLCILHYIDKF